MLGRTTERPIETQSRIAKLALVLVASRMLVSTSRKRAMLVTLACPSSEAMRQKSITCVLRYR